MDLFVSDLMEPSYMDLEKIENVEKLLFSSDIFYRFTSFKIFGCK